MDERPEEVTDFKRNTPANVIAASSDMSIQEHIETAEYAMEVVAQQVIEGKDVRAAARLDHPTRARLQRRTADGSGRTMSGGLDSNAMQSPRQIFGAARKIEDGGSLTILGTALIDTGSRMDQVIFEEFKGTGNSEIFLSRELAERRIYPAIDIAKSGTRKEEKLYPADIVPRIHLLRRGLAGLHPQEAMTKLLELLNRCKTEPGNFRASEGLRRAPHPGEPRRALPNFCHTCAQCREHHRVRDAYCREFARHPAARGAVRARKTPPRFCTCIKCVTGHFTTSGRIVWMNVPS